MQIWLLVRLLESPLDWFWSVSLPRRMQVCNWNSTKFNQIINIFIESCFRYLFFDIFSLGKCFEVTSTDASLYTGKDGIVFNFFVADTELIFDGITELAVTVDQYRNGALINESISVLMYNSTMYSPSVGDGFGKRANYLLTPGQFETGDFLCLFAGKAGSWAADIS